ncbi:MAG: hypothetical protein FWH29_03540 [Methanobrevibacter sp.]|nr:hypothetical protein [Methanobrevibacter sp.]
MATVLIKDDLFKSISKIAKKKNTTESKIVNEAIESFLNNDNDEILSFEELAGIATTDESFNAVELRRKIRTGELE